LLQQRLNCVIAWTQGSLLYGNKYECTIDQELAGAACIARSMLTLRSFSLTIGAKHFNVMAAILKS